MTPKPFPNLLAGPSTFSAVWCQIPMFPPQQPPQFAGWASWSWSCFLKVTGKIFLTKTIRSGYESDKNHLMVSKTVYRLIYNPHPVYPSTSPFCPPPLGSSAHVTWLYFWPLKALRSLPPWYYLHFPISEKLVSHTFTWWQSGHSDLSWSQLTVTSPGYLSWPLSEDAPLPPSLHFTPF